MEEKKNWPISIHSRSIIQPISCGSLFLVSDSEGVVTSWSQQLPTLPPPPADSAVLERERTNIREKEERRIRGRPAVEDVFLASNEGLLESEKKKNS